MILNFIGIFKVFIAAMVTFKRQNLFAQPFCPAGKHVGCSMFCYKGNTITVNSIDTSEMFMSFKIVERYHMEQ